MSTERIGRAICPSQGIRLPPRPCKGPNSIPPHSHTTLSTAHPSAIRPLPHPSLAIPHWSARSTWLLYNQLPFRARLTHRPDDGGSTHLWNVGRHRFDYTAVYPRRLWISYSLPWEPEISHSRLLSPFSHSDQDDTVTTYSKVTVKKSKGFFLQRVVNWVPRKRMVSVTSS
jgi:hypothetical protein